jgi:hypothetical protein
MIHYITPYANNQQEKPPFPVNVVKIAVIANQRARWCGNLLLI